MKDEEKTWQENLIEKYPSLLRGTYPSVGQGWEQLIDEMLNQIKHHMRWQSKNKTVVKDGEEPPAKGEWIDDPYFVQVKEKFGCLRTYHYGGDATIRGIVSMAEGISFYTCEVCGNKGESRKLSWQKVLCDKHYEEIINCVNPEDV